MLTYLDLWPSTISNNKHNQNKCTCYYSKLCGSWTKVLKSIVPFRISDLQKWSNLNSCREISLWQNHVFSHKRQKPVPEKGCTRRVHPYCEKGRWNEVKSEPNVSIHPLPVGVKMETYCQRQEDNRSILTIWWEEGCTLMGADHVPGYYRALLIRRLTLVRWCKFSDWTPPD